MLLMLPVIVPMKLAKCLAVTCHVYPWRTNILSPKALMNWRKWTKSFRCFVTQIAHITCAKKKMACCLGHMNLTQKRIGLPKMTRALRISRSSFGTMTLNASNGILKMLASACLFWAPRASPVWLTGQFLTPLMACR